MRKAKEIFDELHCWAEDNDQIRGLVLSSSRVDGEAETDLLSDYDVVLFVTDQEPYGRDDDWLETFGPVMTRWPPRPTWTEEGEVFQPGDLRKMAYGSTGESPKRNAWQNASTRPNPTGC